MEGEEKQSLLNHRQQIWGLGENQVLCVPCDEFEG